MKILVIDDDARITALLKRALSFEGYQVFTAADGAAGVGAAESCQVDLVILDITMPVLDGWEVCRRLRLSSDVPVLMLTARDEVADRVRGLDCGADDYLVKPFALEELLARVRSLLRRKNSVEAKRPLTFSDLILDTGAMEARRGDKMIALTAREYNLLKIFMENPRQVLTRDLLMDRIWGFDYQGESNVLEVYINMLRQKTEESGLKRLIHTVRGAGYILRE